MKTEIFETYQEFLEREDTTVNGVSKEYARKHPEYQKNNETNIGCWNCFNCSNCSDCSDCSYCYCCCDCSCCSDCSYCSDCSCCSYCCSCSDCSYCSYCRDYSEKERSFKVPIIRNIHQRVYEAVQEKNAFDMSDWHRCNTTHCRAGWVVTLAGEDGRNLEKLIGTPLAANAIYQASSDIKVDWVYRFFEDDHEAMKDIKRCAELERKNPAIEFVDYGNNEKIEAETNFPIYLVDDEKQK